MKPFCIYFGKKYRCEGFSLVEATLSIGILSFGFLSLAPLLALGMKSSRQAQDNRATSQIAQTLIEEAKQGTLITGTTYRDDEANTCAANAAIYTVVATSQALTTDGSSTLGTPTRLTVRITPVGSPDRARTYAVVFPAPQ